MIVGPSSIAAENICSSYRNGTLNPILSQTEFNIATLKMRGIYVVTLTKDEPSLFAPRSDEGINRE